MYVEVTTEVEAKQVAAWRRDVKVMIAGNRSPGLFRGLVAFEDLRDFIVACSGVRAADAFHVPRCTRPRARRQVIPPTLGDSRDGD